MLVVSSQCWPLFLASKILDKIPTEFAQIRTSGKEVNKLTRQLFPGDAADPSSLNRMPETGIHIVKFSDEALKNQPPEHPAVALVRPVNMIPRAVQEKIIRLWDRMKAEGLELTGHSKGDNRSSTPALHCGVWHLSSKNPMVTSDTCKQNPRVEALLKEFMDLIKTHVAPVVRGAI